MAVVTVSPKYQVVIPREVREFIKLKPGDKLQVFCIDGRIELVRARPLKKMRGFASGIDTTVERERDRL